MKEMKIKSIFFILILLFTIATAKENNVQISFGRYVLICSVEDAEFANKIMENAKPGIERIERFFQHSGQDIITIYLTKSTQKFNGFIRNSLPEWSQAVAIPSQKLIVLKFDTARSINNSPNIMLHELVLINLYVTAGAKNVPVWLHEGLAEYLSHDEIELSEKIIVANAIAAKQIIALSDLQTLLDFSATKARLAYLEARLAVDFYVISYGEAKLKELVKKLKHTNFETAFYNVTRKEFIDFEVNWYEEIYEKYRFLIILNFENLLWIFMIALFFIALYVKKRMKIKKYKQWKQEEELRIISKDEGF